MADQGEYETLDSRDVHTGYSTVRVETVAMPDGERTEREVVVHDDAVAIVALTPEGEVVLLRQYRQPMRKAVLEIPAGKLDQEGESPEQAVERELAEEAGYAVERLEHLTTFYNSAGWTDEQTHVYLGHGAYRVDPPDGFEAEHEEAGMEILHLDFDEALAQATRGEIPDAKTLIGLLLAASHR